MKYSNTPQHHKTPGKQIMGSTKRTNWDDCFMTHSEVDERVINVLLSGEISDKILEEEKAWSIIRDFRDRCVKPQMYNPTDGELGDIIKALRILWLLLPPIKKLKGEKNKTFFLRTLHEINKFRGIDMYSAK